MRDDGKGGWDWHPFVPRFFFEPSPQIASLIIELSTIHAHRHQLHIYCIIN
jgi:16S rRNA A1518/A1519 N6-dimethyltransferase RsmA/KsgA/DIM1 with predicted DNA glycosylase/AP lyase activity